MIVNLTIAYKRQKNKRLQIQITVLKTMNEDNYEP